MTDLFVREALTTVDLSKEDHMTFVFQCAKCKKEYPVPYYFHDEKGKNYLYSRYKNEGLVKMSNVRSDGYLTPQSEAKLTAKGYRLIRGR